MPRFTKYSFTKLQNRLSMSKQEERLHRNQNRNGKFLNPRKKRDQARER